MILSLTKAMSGVALSTFAVTGLACEIPKLVAIPAADERLGQEPRLQAEAVEYFAAMEAYVECLQAELDAAGGNDAPELVRTALVRRNNIAVAEAEIVMSLYNEAFGGDGAPGD